MQPHGVEVPGLAAISPSALKPGLPSSRVLNAGSAEGNGPPQTTTPVGEGKLSSVPAWLTGQGCSLGGHSCEWEMGQPLK